IGLYESAASSSPGTEVACGADRARAMLAGEVTPKGAYRELYLAERRQSATLKAADSSPCVRQIRKDVALLAAFRPSESEMPALVAEGESSFRAALEAASPSAPAPASSPGAPASAAPASGVHVVVSSDLPKA